MPRARKVDKPVVAIEVDAEEERDLARLRRSVAKMRTRLETTGEDITSMLSQIDGKLDKLLKVPHPKTVKVTVLDVLLVLCLLALFFVVGWTFPYPK